MARDPPGFAVVAQFFRASPEGIWATIDILAADFERSTDTDRAGLGGPGHPGISVWIEADRGTVLSNISSGQTWMSWDGSPGRATYDLWFPLDVAHVATGVDVVMAWPECTGQTRRIHLGAKDLADAISRVVSLSQ